MSRIILILMSFLVSVHTAGCAKHTSPDSLQPSENSTVLTSARLSINTEGHLQAFFKCLRNKNIAVVSAHRGGPLPGLPENALETFDYISRNAVVVIELDVLTSKDGTLFLHHDDTLDRTTTGKGLATSKNWHNELQSVKLVDNDGQLTLFSIPTLRQALDWSKERALLQIDIKPPTKVDAVMDEVIRANAEGRVFYIAYNLEDAARIQERMPDALVEVGFESKQKIALILNAGLDIKRIHALTGEEGPRGSFYDALNESSITVVAGTYGRPQSIDESIGQKLAFKESERYRQAMARGVQILVSNRPLDAFKSLKNNNKYLEYLNACSLKRDG